jgi:hypothetical protein
MVWFFERSGQFIRCETRDDQDGVWELVVAEPGRPERIERFGKGDELEDRIRELRRDFLTAGWGGPHGHFI